MSKGILVLAPLRVCYTSWPNELRKWKEFNHLKFQILHGSKKSEALKQKADVYIMNYEGLPWLSEQLGKLKVWPFDMLVADESTKIRHTNTQRFKILRPLLNKFKRRVILTGSPVANNLLDIFGQCYVMDSGATLGPYVTAFRKEFFFQTGFGGYTWLPKANAQTEIFERLAPRVFYAHDEDYLQLPDLIEKDVVVELPPKVKAMYDQMETALRLDFEAGRVVASNTGVASMKCRQIANGGVYLDGFEKEWQQVHEAKTEAVVDLIEELSGQPALVTYDFLHDLERLKKALGADTPHIGKGGITPAQLPALISRWNAGHVPVIIVSPQSMSHGVDGLQEAGRAVIWASLTYNNEDYIQLIARLRRSGATERVLVAHIIAKDTVDEAVMAALRRKERGQSALFSALKDYWSEKEV